MVNEFNIIRRTAILVKIYFRLIRLDNWTCILIVSLFDFNYILFATNKLLYFWIFPFDGCAINVTSKVFIESRVLIHVKKNYREKQ